MPAPWRPSAACPISSCRTTPRWPSSRPASTSPQVNRTYAEMAEHYDTAILPARPRKPRDKAKVEPAVLIVERWLFGRLRRRIVPQPCRVEPAHPRDACRYQRAQRPSAGSASPAGSCSKSWTGRRSSLCRRSLTSIAEWRGAPGRHRLSRRGRRPLLQRSLPLRQRRARGAADGAHGRDVPQGRADRGPYAQVQRQRQAHDHCRAHALEPPALRRLDHRAHPREDVGRLATPPPPCAS